MKAILLIFLFGCTTSVSTQRIVILDASQSKVTGGDGTGRIVTWQWKDLNSDRIVANTSKATVIVDEGEYRWQLKAIDNLGNEDSAVLKATVR